MDIYNNIIAGVSPILDKFTLTVDKEQQVNVLICVYILLFMFIKPYKATEIAKMPIIQLSIIAYILYTSRENYVTATLVAIAFLITLITNHDENNYSRDTAPIEIENREKFTGDDETDLAEEYSNNRGSSDNEDESDSDDSDKEDESDSDDSDSDDSDSEDDDIDPTPIKTKKTSKASQKNINRKQQKKNKKNKEDFLSGNLLPKNSMNDTFKDLHVAIHKLENFISTPD
jgi:hypothetical protein